MQQANVALWNINLEVSTSHTARGPLLYAFPLKAFLSLFLFLVMGLNEMPSATGQPVETKNMPKLFQPAGRLGPSLSASLVFVQNVQAIVAKKAQHAPAPGWGQAKLFVARRGASSMPAEKSWD